MKKRRIEKRALWAMTPVILALILFPYSGSYLFAGEKDANIAEGEVRVEWTIEGMTCEWCAKGLEGGMSRVEGVRNCTVDYESKWMVCSLDESVIDAETIPGIVKEMGYTAAPAEEGNTRKKGHQ